MFNFQDQNLPENDNEKWISKFQDQNLSENDNESRIFNFQDENLSERDEVAAWAQQEPQYCNIIIFTFKEKK